MRARKKQNTGIALMIVLSSVIILTIGIRELILKTGAQVDRVRNTYDRIQALYLAKSAQNLGRFMVILDKVANADIDSSQSLWNNPMPFPLPVAALNSMTNEDSEEVERSDLNSEERGVVDRCNDFYQSFGGEAYTQVQDESSRLNLNDLNREDAQEVLTRLMTRDFELIQSLRDRQINPEEVVREAVEYISREVEFPTIPPPDYEYEPKRREMSVPEEFKMLPSVDEELFQSIKDDITAVSFPRRPRPSKMNVNTMSPELFQSLLIGVGNPESIAENFQNLREEGRVFTDAQLEELLDLLSLEASNLPMELLSGKSSAYRLTTYAQVGQSKIELVSLMKPPSSAAESQPYFRVRLAP